MSAEKVAKKFQVPGRLVTLISITTGNVNDTYRVILRTTYSEKQFILQRINKTVFTNPALVMSNMKRVTDHAHRRIESEADHADRIWQLPRVIPAKDGRDYVTDYLAGDVYFKTSYDAQNLNRARVQLKLCDSIESNEAPMLRALENRS
ncbi:MAG: hypothetical protein L3J39_16995 [Verrucomicrobiales bacterium]|nr:hypothetical protein [Verrucomicrobiales bacterium]